MLSKIEILVWVLSGLITSFCEFRILDAQKKVSKKKKLKIPLS